MKTELIPPGFEASDALTPDGLAIMADYWDEEHEPAKANAIRKIRDDSPTFRQTLILRCCYPDGGRSGPIKEIMGAAGFSSDGMAVGPALCTMLDSYPTSRSHRSTRVETPDGLMWKINGELYKEYPYNNPSLNLQRDPNEGVKGWLTRRKVKHTQSYTAHIQPNLLAPGTERRDGRVVRTGVKVSTAEMLDYQEEVARRSKNVKRTRTREDFLYELTPLGLAALQHGISQHFEKLYPDLLESIWEQLQNDNYEFIESTPFPDVIRPLLSLHQEGNLTYQEFRDTIASGASLSPPSLQLPKPPA